MGQSCSFKFQEYRLPNHFKPTPNNPNLYKSSVSGCYLLKRQITIPYRSNFIEQYQGTIFRKCNSDHLLSPKYFQAGESFGCDLNYHISYFMEIIDHRLSDIVSFSSYSQALYILIQIFEGYAILIRKYGYFIVTAQMIFFVNDKVTVWLSQNTLQNNSKKENYNISEREFVQNLIKLVDERVNFSQMCRQSNKALRKKTKNSKGCFQNLIQKNIQTEIDINSVLKYLNNLQQSDQSQRESQIEMLSKDSRIIQKNSRLLPPPSNLIFNESNSSPLQSIDSKKSLISSKRMDQIYQRLKCQLKQKKRQQQCQDEYQSNFHQNSTQILKNSNSSPTYQTNHRQIFNQESFLTPVHYLSKQNQNNQGRITMHQIRKNQQQYFRSKNTVKIDKLEQQNKLHKEKEKKDNKENKKSLKQLKEIRQSVDNNEIKSVYYINRNSTHKQGNLQKMSLDCMNFMKYQANEDVRKTLPFEKKEKLDIMSETKDKFSRKSMQDQKLQHNIHYVSNISSINKELITKKHLGQEQLSQKENNDLISVNRRLKNEEPYCQLEKSKEKKQKHRYSQQSNKDSLTKIKNQRKSLELHTKKIWQPTNISQNKMVALQQQNLHPNCNKYEEKVFKNFGKKLTTIKSIPYSQASQKSYLDQAYYLYK